MTREVRIYYHQKAVAWVNEQIRLCLLARRVLKGYNPEKYYMHIVHATVHCGAELLQLREALFQNPVWALRFESYRKGLINKVFDVTHYIAEARTLKIKQQELPWLAGHHS
jgi:hypothetical protein